MSENNICCANTQQGSERSTSNCFGDGCGKDQAFAMFDAMSEEQLAEMDRHLEAAQRDMERFGSAMAIDPGLQETDMAHSATTMRIFADIGSRTDALGERLKSAIQRNFAAKMATMRLFASLEKDRKTDDLHEVVVRATELEVECSERILAGLRAGNEASKSL